MIDKDIIVRQKFEIEVSVNKREVLKKYPNFNHSFTDVEEFINFITSDIIHSGEIDLSKDAMELFGYSVTIKKLF